VDDYSLPSSTRRFFPADLDLATFAEVDGSLSRVEALLVASGEVVGWLPPH
jgi:hypothetical protein